MDDKRQQIQLKLAFMEEGKGEALRASREGTEASVVVRAPESPAICEYLMEEVLERDNLRKALRRVKSNKGSPGIDGMSVWQLPGYLKEHWQEVRDRLVSGTYKPQPVKRAEIAKPGGGVRKLGIPTVLDRFIQQALLQVLQKYWDSTFSEHSFGFRPKRSAHQAVACAQQHLADGYCWIVDIDLEKFFDRVNHDMLMGRAAKRVRDRRVLKLIRAFLNAGVMENGLVSPITKGTPQGGPLSPLLSNIVLDDLDRELERRGHRFVRYADDCNVYVRSRRAGRRVMESLTRFITRNLKLKVNEAKSAVVQPWECTFLGFSFTSGPEPKRRIAPQAIERLKQRIRKLTRRTRTVGLRQMVVELARYLTGWKSYFGFGQTIDVLKKLDSWIRRRLRCVAWKQWKRGRVRFAELRARGVIKDLAAQTAGSPHGSWRISRSPALSFAFPNAYFKTLGLPSLVST
jgi:RNA-directed DNA polymerase